MATDEPVRYLVSVHGCDDTTKISRLLSDAEVCFLTSIAIQITLTSEYACMPRMKVREYPADYDPSQDDDEDGDPAEW